MIEVAGTFGTKVYYGDGMRLDLLRLAGAETAKAILFCNDNRGRRADPRSDQSGAGGLSRRRRCWSGHSTACT